VTKSGQKQIEFLTIWQAFELSNGRVLDDLECAATVRGRSSGG
jgi:hypothetical protein